MVNVSHKAAKRGSPSANLQPESDVIVPLIGSPIRITWPDGGASSAGSLDEGAVGVSECLSHPLLTTRQVAKASAVAIKRIRRSAGIMISVAGMSSGGGP
jgi:hypothetical protein